jgi:uncharacterized protein
MQTFDWCTGPHGATWHLVNRGILDLLAARRPDLRFHLTTAGGRDNPTRVDDGRSHFGTTVDFLAAAALHGREPYRGAHRRLATIGSGWLVLPFHVVVTGDGPPPTLKTLLRSPGTRLAVPPPATADELTFQRVLSFYDLSYPALAAGGSEVFHGSYTEILEAFRGGQVDHLFGATAAPADAIADIAEAGRGARLAPLPADLVAYLARASYRPGVIPRDTYPSMQDADVPTVYMRTTFLASIAVPDDVVEAVTSTLLASRRDLPAIHPSLAAFEPVAACTSLPVPLHPGAERAYRLHNVEVSSTLMVRDP